MSVTLPGASPFERIQVGTVVTRFGEPVTRVFHGTYADAAPPWFHPTENKAHNAMHRNGYSVYFEIDLDEDARENAHPFDKDVAPRAIFIEQLTLLGRPVPATSPQSVALVDDIMTAPAVNDAQLRFTF